MKVESESEVAQSCPTLSDCSPPGSSVHGILQARALEWGAIPNYTVFKCYCFAKFMKMVPRFMYSSLQIMFSTLSNLLLNSSPEGNGTPLQYFCLENPTDGGAW